MAYSLKFEQAKFDIGLDLFGINSINPRPKLSNNLFHLTSAFLHDIRVVFFLVKSTIGDNVGKCIVHKASIATIVVSSITINQLLLGEWSQISCNNLVYTFHCSNSWKCPATTCIFINYSKSFNSNRSASVFCTSVHVFVLKRDRKSVV